MTPKLKTEYDNAITIFVEDDAAPDAETLNQAWERLFGTPRNQDEQDDELDGGDYLLYKFTHGRFACVACDGKEIRMSENAMFHIFRGTIPALHIRKLATARLQDQVASWFRMQKQLHPGLPRIPASGIPITASDISEDSATDPQSQREIDREVHLALANVLDGTNVAHGTSRTESAANVIAAFVKLTKDGIAQREQIDSLQHQVASLVDQQAGNVWVPREFLERARIVFGPAIPCPEHADECEQILEAFRRLLD